MMNAGRVRHHLANNIEDPTTTILIVGYCTPDTPGGMLRAGIKELKLFGMTKTVKAEVEIMDSFSAHGDQREMKDFLSNQKDKNRVMFLVHGEIESQTVFKDVLTKDGHKNIEIPEKGQEYTLN